MLFSVLMFEYNISRYSLINKMDSGTGSECVKRTQAKLGDLRPSGKGLYHAIFYLKEVAVFSTPRYRNV